MGERSSLRLLGPALVERNGQVVQRLASGKALALLAYLIVQGQPMSREHLADLFWRHMPPDRGRANLSWTLHKITSLLPGCLDAHRDCVCFCRPEGCWLDLDAFEENVAQGKAQSNTSAPDAGSLAQAATLYRGDFLQGLVVDGCADFELWLVGERERWRQRAVDVLSELIAHHCARGEREQGLGYARRLLALAPWQEETHRQVMRLLAELGQRSAALAQYEACRRALGAELGVAPAEETVALYEQIRDGEMMSRPPRTNLPAPTTPFIGRETQLAEVRTLLARPEVRLLTLTGVGGTGKTRLALQVAAGLVDEYADGVYLVELASLRDPALVVPTLAATLGVRESGGTPLIASLQYALRDKARLLVIDNFEHVAEAAPAVSELLAATPRLKVLATSRAPLRVYGEHEYAVPPMEFPRLHGAPALERLAQVEAVSLFVQGAQRVSPGFRLSEENAPAVAEICAWLDGLPLAIELAAARIKLFSPRAMLDRLDGSHGLRFLTAGPRDLPARQRSLRATIEWSYGLLSPNERTLFSWLSVFAGGCTLEAVEAICVDASPVVAHTDVERPSSVALLQSLTDQSLIQASRSTPRRFTMLETVRAYAAELLEKSGQAQALCDRHAAYYASALKSWALDLKGHRQLDALAEIEADLDNARAAWAWAVDGVPGRTQTDWLDQALEGLCLFYEWRGRYQQGEDACRRAAERLEDAVSAPIARGNTEQLRVLAHLLARQGHFGFLLGHVEAADRCFERSLVLLDGPDLGDQRVLAERAYALYRQSEHVAFGGEIERASQLAERSLAAYRALGDDWGVVRVLFRQALVAWRFAAFDRAEQLLKEGLALSRASGDGRGIAMVLSGLAAVATSQGELEQAEPLAREGLALARKVEDGEVILEACFCLALTLRRLGRFAEARSPLEERLAFCRLYGDRRREVNSLYSLSMADRHLGFYARARASAQTALALSREFGQVSDIGASCMELGRIALAEAAYQEASEWLQQSIAAYEDAERPRILYQSRVASAYVARALGRPSLARQHLLSSLRMTAKTGDHLVALESLPAVALLALDGGRPGRTGAERAVELYALATRYPYVANSRWFEDVAGREVRAAADVLLPQVAAVVQERGRARDLWATVEELLEELGRSPPS